MYLPPWDIVNGYGTTTAPPVPIKKEPGMTADARVTIDRTVWGKIEVLLGPTLTHVVVCPCATHRTRLESGSRINFQPH